LQTNKKILVVDDDAHVRRVLELKLRKQGYHVLSAIDGQVGLSMIQTEQPDAVITDIMMPNLNGKMLVTKTNDLKRTRRFLTIVMTNRVASEDRVWVQKMVDTVLMKKPFSPSRLASFIDAYFAGGSL
jgi:DNA-binding response OmpR family regulator